MANRDLFRPHARLGLAVHIQVVLMTSLLLSPAVAFAGDTKIVNKSGVPIDQLYASAPGKQAWGANLLEGAPEGSLDSGRSYSVAALADGVYDLRIEAPDEGVFCVMKGVKVTAGKATLDVKLGQTCK